MEYLKLKEKFFIMAGPNVIESEEHVIHMAKMLKQTFDKYDVTFIFKVSFDKANRSSLNSYRGVSFEKGVEILKKIKQEVDVPIITDIHESWQAEPISKVVDIIQIPAFLCRQTDLLKAAAQTGKIIHVKKGQFCSADQMHKAKEKIIAFGNRNVILCERGNSFGYQDLVVDPRNLIWLKSDTNLVSMDITHCLQQPGQKMADGTIQCGGYRDLIPYMGKMAISLGINGIFMETHDNPDKALCDGPTQWPLDKLEWLLDFLNINKKNNNKILKIVIPCRINSTRLNNKMLLTINNINIINRTINSIKKSNYNDIITVISDSSRILDTLPEDINKIINKKNYLNGTERISDNLDSLDCDYIMIIHGDQPFINYNNINIMLDYFKKNNINNNEILMGYSEIDEKEADNSSIAKIVTDINDNLLYISRSKIPYFKNNSLLKYKKGTSLLIIPKEKLILYNKYKTSNLQFSEDNEWIKFIDTLDCKVKCLKLNYVERDLNNMDDYNYLKNKYESKL